MAKWADYCISAVRYDSQKTHIDRVRVHIDNGDKLGAGEEWSRSSVVSSLEGGKTFVTTTKDSEGKWKKGEDVHIIEIKGKKYIRTDANNTESDNLGQLPEF